MKHSCQSLIYCFSLLLLIFLIGCDNSSEPEQLYVASDRFTDDFSFSSSVNKIVVTNAIGFTFLYGNTNTSKVSIVMDRKVSAKTKSAAQNELSRIYLEHIVSNDTLYCNIIHNPDLNNIYDCTLSLDVPYNKDVIIKNPNKGIQSAYLNSDLIIETDAYETTVEPHSGSLEAHSTNGNIASVLTIPTNGFCKCYSTAGDIHIKIPTSTSANVTLKTISGAITYSNLNIYTTVNTNTELQGILGFGTGTIYLENQSGNILLEGI